MEEHNVTLVMRWFEEVWNQRREETIDELLHRDMIGYGLQDEPIGFEEFKQAWRGLLATLTDLHIDVVDTIASGSKVASRIVCTAIHSGPGLGVPATGLPVKFESQNIQTWEDGKIVRGWVIIDMASIYRQIGTLIA